MVSKGEEAREGGDEREADSAARKRSAPEGTGQREADGAAVGEGSAARAIKKTVFFSQKNKLFC